MIKDYELFSSSKIISVSLNLDDMPSTQVWSDKCIRPSLEKLNVPPDASAVQWIDAEIFLYKKKEIINI